MRLKVRAQRRQLSSTNRDSHNQSINRELLACVSKLKVTSLSAFWPFDGEPDLRSALNTLESSGVRIALPVLDSHQPVMTMHQWRPVTVMRENRFLIPEPLDEPMVEVSSLDLLLIPLVAWDANGGRLGMGAGYYDRILAPLSTMNGPHRIGIAFSLQEVPKVPVNAMDIPLHGLICENGWTEFDL